MRKFLLLFSLLVSMALGTAKADTADIDFTKQGYSNGTSQPTDVAFGNCTITFDKGTNTSSQATWYDSGSALRIYPANTIKVAAPAGATLTEITFTVVKDYGFGAETGLTSGTLANDVWTGSANEVTLTVQSDRTSSKQIRLQKVAVTYTTAGGSEVTVAAPVISMEPGNMVVLSHADGGDIYYTTDGTTEPTNASTKYTEPFAITEATTVKAVAYVDGEHSNVATKLCNLNSVESIAAFKALAPTWACEISAPLYVIYQNGINLYVKDDNEDFMLIYQYKGSESLSNGQVIEGVTGTYSPYAGLPEIVWASNGEVGNGDGEVEPYEVNAADIDLNMLNQYVLLSGVKIVNTNGKNYSLTDADGNTVTLYNTFATTSTSNNYTVVEIPEGEGFDVYAIVSCYNTTLQLTPVKIEGGKEMETVATPVFNPESRTQLAVGSEITITCETEGAQIYYTTEDETPTTASFLYEGPISFTEAMTIKAIAVKEGMLDSDVATATYDILVEGVSTAVFDFSATTGDNCPFSLCTVGSDDMFTPTSAQISTTANTGAVSLQDKKFENGPIAVVYDKGTNTNNKPIWAWFNNNSNYESRIYTNNTLNFTVSQDGYKITKIEFAQVSGSTTYVDPKISANVELPTTISEYYANKVFTAPAGAPVNSVLYTFTGTSRIAIITVTYEEDADALAGIDTIAGDNSDAAPEYFNLQGIRVAADNLTPGIYVRRQGSEVVKVLVK